MISKNTSISDLRAISTPVNGRTVYDNHMDELARFLNEYPSVETLGLLMCRFTAVNAITFIRQLKSLTFFFFELKDRFEYDIFISQLGGDWTHYITSKFNKIFITIFR